MTLLLVSAWICSRPIYIKSFQVFCRKSSENGGKLFLTVATGSNHWAIRDSKDGQAEKKRLGPAEGRSPRGLSLFTTDLAFLSKFSGILLVG